MFCFERLELESFEKLKVGKLKGLIAVRLSSNLTELKKRTKLMPDKKIPRKGRVDLASLEDFNLMSKAFELRSEISAFEIGNSLETEINSEKIAQT